MRPQPWPRRRDSSSAPAGVLAISNSGSECPPACGDRDSRGGGLAGSATYRRARLGRLCQGQGPTSLTACSHSRICGGTMRCRCLRGCAPPSVSLPSRLRRCRRVPGSAQMPGGRRQGPWPVPSGPATSPSASGRCWPSVTAHQCEDGSRRPPSPMPGTWPPPSQAGDHALGSVVSSSSPLPPVVPWRAAGSPAR
jgi:hypothetical protein